MIIYKITNTIDSKIYIGQTISSLTKRWGDHCSKGSNCRFLSRAIQKYGKDNFTIEKIDEAETLDQLNVKEIYWIKHYNSLSPNGYNLTSRGNNGRLLSQETKNKIGMSNLGKKRTEEVKEIFRQNNLGKKLSPDHIEKLRQANLGKKRTSKLKGIPRSKEVISKMVETRKLRCNYNPDSEAKEKMRLAKLGTKQSEASKRKRSEKLTGIVRSEETRKKMSLAKKGIPGKKQTPGSIQKMLLTKARKKLLQRLRNIIKED